MKTVLLLLSTDRFSIPLIRYLVLEGKRYGWKTCIGSMFDNSFVDRIREEKVSNDLIFINITDFRQCDHAIRKSDLVIGMIPDVMLLQVADSCISHRKPLIAPSRLNRQLFAKKQQAEENNTLILVECGFMPGLDHITAKNVIDNIHVKGGKISSFKTHGGSLIADGSIDNPWEFKLTEPALDLINLGKGNNRHVIQDQLQYVTHQTLFARAAPLPLKGMRNLVTIPEDDALYCRKVYDLADAHTVIKGRVMRKGFETLWNLLVRLGFTNTSSKVELFDDRSYHNFLRSLLPYSENELLEIRLRKYAGATGDDIDKLKWIGLFNDDWPEGYREITPAVVLQHLLENKLSMRPQDRDCIIMCHELEYTTAHHVHTFSATLIAQGEDQRNSATAKAIGLTAGAAAKAVLLGNIKIKGLHTPTKKEIYEPILSELVDLGVAFHVEEKKTRRAEVDEAVPKLS